MTEHELIEFVTAQRWFASKLREVTHASVVDRAMLRDADPFLELQLVEIRFDTGTHETYQLLTNGGLDALADPRQVRELVHMIRSGVKLPARDGIVEFGAVEGIAELGQELREARPIDTEQSNTSIVFDEELILKVFRRLEAGINPELELLRFLTDRGFENIAQLAGWYAYSGRPMDATLGILQRFIPGGQDGWELALNAMQSGTERFLGSLRRLGEVTGRMHSVLGSDPSDPSFAPEAPSSESLGLLTATIDDEIESVFLELPDGNDDVAPIRGRGEEVRERLRLWAQV
ncbi:MAG: maltokinase N-terminal cap-like domain-containing protein, partial [Gaiellaceae bacterium]